MSDVDSQHDCPRCRELTQLVQQYERRIAELEARVQKLTERLEQSLRSGKRQAAPFSKGKKSDPRPPGRKPGDDYGPKAFRAAVRPEQITETYEVPLPDRCPECQSRRLKKTDVSRQYQVEIPVEPIYRQFNIHIGCCRDCGSRVQARHELQTNDALGAAASQIGPRAQALSVLLNKELGLSYGKIQTLFERCFGIAFSRAAPVHIVQRTADKLQPTLEKIRRSIRGSPQVAGDETGWRVEGCLAWLHVFAANQATYFQIHPRRNDEVGRQLLGDDYQGVLVHDGWSVYDELPCREHQTCLAHLLRRCRELIEQATPSAARFPRALIRLFQAALATRDLQRDGQLSERSVLRRCDNYLRQMMRLLSRGRRNSGNERLANHIWKHRDQVFTFLLEDSIDATNWRAEQAIRPAVVNRKVWGGNRTWNGASAQSTLMSAIVTWQQQSHDPFATLVRLLTQLPDLRTR
jgi:transposase